jgi:hypothetical protein
MVARRNRFLSQNIYQLKRQFGVALRIIRRLSSPVTDLRTGSNVQQYEKYDLQYAVLLPTKEVSSEEWAREATIFSRGGYFEVGTRTFLVDTKDLPIDFKIKEDDYLVYNSRRYDIFQIEDYEESRAYKLIAQESKTSGPIFDVHCPALNPDVLQVNAVALGVVI